MNENNERGKYWCVCLDSRTIKTIYKDELYIPSKALAIALSEEWESQNEIIDLQRCFHLNRIMAQSVRATHDLSLIQHMHDEIMKILEND